MALAQHLASSSDGRLVKTGTATFQRYTECGKLVPVWQVDNEGPVTCSHCNKIDAGLSVLNGSDKTESGINRRRKQ